MQIYFQKFKPLIFPFASILIAFISLSEIYSISFKNKFSNTLGVKSKQLIITGAPDEHILVITGTASKNLDTNIVRISIKIETQDEELRKAYVNNTNISNNA